MSQLPGDDGERGRGAIRGWSAVESFRHHSSILGVGGEDHLHGGGIPGGVP